MLAGKMAFLSFFFFIIKKKLVLAHQGQYMHSNANDRTALFLFFFFCSWVIFPVYMCTFSIHSANDDTLVDSMFWLLQAALQYLFDTMSFGYITSGGNAGQFSKSISSFGRDVHAVFCGGCTDVHSRPLGIMRFPFYRPLPTSATLCALHDSHCHCVSDLHFPDS